MQTHILIWLDTSFDTKWPSNISLVVKWTVNRFWNVSHATWSLSHLVFKISMGPFRKLWWLFMIPVLRGGIAASIGRGHHLRFMSLHSWGDWQMLRQRGYTCRWLERLNRLVVELTTLTPRELLGNIQSPSAFISFYRLYFEIKRNLSKSRCHENRISLSIKITVWWLETQRTLIGALLLTSIHVYVLFMEASYCHIQLFYLVYRVLTVELPGRIWGNLRPISLIKVDLSVITDVLNRLLNTWDVSHEFNLWLWVD